MLYILIDIRHDLTAIAINHLKNKYQTSGTRFLFSEQETIGILYIVAIKISVSDYADLNAHDMFR